MSYVNLSDCHNHSSFSLDGKDSAIAMLNRAQELNLKYYTLTDHCECNTYIEEGYNNIVSGSYKEMTRLKNQYNGKVNFLMGVELGQPLQNLSAAEDALKDKDYDVVLGSLHNLANCKDFYFWDQNNLEVYPALDEYFKELIAMIEWGKFDTLTHLTYPLRYIVGDMGIKVDFDRYTPQVEDVFKRLINKNIALEVNTSGLRQKIGETLPNEKILRMYKALGGQLITIGSDAHSVNDLGKGIAEGMDMLKNIGFNSFTVFIKRKPVQIEIK